MIKEQRIYCGPTLPGGRLTAYSVYIGSLPANVQALIDECPEIGRLIVPVDRLAEIRTREKQSGTEEARLCSIVKKHKWEVR